MANTCIGAQLYTARDYCKTAPDLAQTLAKLRKIGYQAVQVSGVGPIDVKEIAKILEGEGMVCAATHKGMDEMKNTSAILDYHAALKCEYTAIGGFGFGGKTMAEWKAFISDYNTVSKTLSAKGLHIGYHNHSHEYAKVDGVVVMDMLVRELDPTVWFEFDTYWVQHGGGDPAAWIERVAGRIPCVHFKDISIDHERKHKMVEVGSGNLNWPRILEACKKAGVKWYLVERDSGELDPIESLRISYDNMRKMGLN